jgi:hypothetical protein
MSTIAAPARPHWTSAALWAVRGLLALAVVLALNAVVAHAERGRIGWLAETSWGLL